MSQDPGNLSQQARIDAICDRFEAQWNRGQPLDVESLIKCEPAELRNNLLRELLRVELAYRRRRGDSPDPQEYLRRFPGAAGAVNRLFHDEGLNGGSQPDDLAPGCTAPSVRLRRSSGECRFEKRRQHAEGGLGRVTVALDTELIREVAYKEIRPEYAEMEESRARFVLEAEVTGRLEHPGIVPVYSLGADPGGRPFYAMRLVHGETLGAAIARFHGVPHAEAAAGTAATPPTTERSEPSRSLASTERVQQEGAASDPPSTSAGPDFASLEFRKLLGRLVSVCQAVAYAHRRGVVHRDLKPANIMLGPFGETLVLDWGLAKLVGASEPGGLGEPLVPQLADPSATTLGAVIGTPAFMSPEQAAGRAGEVSRPADIYGLGAILYGLLANHPPVQSDSREALLANVAAGQIRPPRSLNRAIPRSLEAVCMKALQLRAENRYASATALADDLERWLADEPVRAYSEPWWARARRWMRRHRTLLGGTVAALVMLAVTSMSGAALLGAAFRREASLNIQLNASNLALEQTNRDLVDANSRESTARQQAEEVADYLVQAFSQAHPNQKGRLLTVADMLAQAVDRLASDARLEPLTRATLFHAIGKTYLGLGLPTDAVPVLERASNIRRENLGIDDERTLDSMNEVGAANDLLGEPNRAREKFSEVYEHARAALGPDHHLTLTVQQNLGAALRESGKFPEAIAMLDRVRLRREELLGRDHPDTLATAANLASAYSDAGQPRQALELLEHVRDRQDVLRDQPVLVVQSLDNLAGAYLEVGRLDDAIALYRQVRERETNLLGPAHPGTLATMAGLATALAMAGHYDEAIAVHQQALEQMNTALPRDHPQVLVAVQNLAMALQLAGRLSEALPLFEEAYQHQRQKFGLDNPTTLDFAYSLGLADVDAGKPAAAVPLLRDALAASQKVRGPDNRLTRAISTALGYSLLASGAYDEAEPRLRDGLNDFLKLQPDCWACANMQVMLGKCLSGQGKFAEAEPLLRDGYEGLKRKEKEIPPGYGSLLPGAVSGLVQLYDDWGKPAEAATWRSVLADRPAGGDSRDTN